MYKYRLITQQYLCRCVSLWYLMSLLELSDSEETHQDLAIQSRRGMVLLLDLVFI